VVLTTTKKTLETMTKKKLEAWVWVLIYGGMLGASFGWFIQPRSAALGWTLMVAGGVVAAIGVVLIFVRARLGP
jgi:hypothetical protein